MKGTSAPGGPGLTLEFTPWMHSQPCTLASPQGHPSEGITYVTSILGEPQNVSNIQCSHEYSYRSILVNVWAYY